MSKLEQLIQELCPDGVEYKTIDELISKKRIKLLSPSIKIKSSQYLDRGDFPIISQELEFISGYTNINDENIPQDEYICFGDHSEHIKFVDFKFVQGADGLKIFKILDCNLIPKYLYYVFCNFYQRHNNYERHTKYLKNTEIPVPPLPIQEEIVRILDSFTEFTVELQTQLDAELQARKKQYEYYRNQIILNSEGKTGKLIDMLAQPVTDGPHTTPTLYEKGVPFISATAVYEGKVHLEDMKGYISKEFDNECAKKYKPKRNDVFMVKSGSTTGKVAFVDFDEDFNIWSPLAAMRTNLNNSPRFLYHLLQTLDIQKQVQERMSHGSQPNLSMRVLEQFDVKIPQLDKQLEIVDILDRFNTLCNDIFSGLPAEIEMRQKQYEYYRNKLLTFKRLEE